MAAQTGSVSDDIQNFLFDQIRANAEPLATVIDSRKLIRYPYSKMGADKEHFWGPETGEWADRIKDAEESDVVAQQLAKSEFVDEESKRLAIEQSKGLKS